MQQAPGMGRARPRDMSQPLGAQRAHAELPAHQVGSGCAQAPQARSAPGPGSGTRLAAWRAGGLTALRLAACGLRLVDLETCAALAHAAISAVDNQRSAADTNWGAFHPRRKIRFHQVSPGLVRSRRPRQDAFESYQICLIRQAPVHLLSCRTSSHVWRLDCL